MKYISERALLVLAFVNICVIVGVIALSASAFSRGFLGLHQSRDPLSICIYIFVIGILVGLMHLRYSAAAFVGSSGVVFIALSGLPDVSISITMIAALLAATALTILLFDERARIQKEILSKSNQKLILENFRSKNFDKLTGLENRNQFFIELHNIIELSRINNVQFAVGIIDIDEFRVMNELYGHADGDQLLIEVAHRLSALRAGDAVLARIGSDEFALIFPHFGDADDLLRFGTKICSNLRNPFCIAGYTVHASASVGFAIYPLMATNGTDLFERAHLALQHAKRNCRGFACLFSGEDTTERHRNANIEKALRAPDLERELTVVFQPITDAKIQSTVGFEALARWTHPELGEVCPAQFIPIAERIGIINSLTQILLIKALGHAGSWPPEVKLSFNLSVHDLASSGAVQGIIRAIDISGFDPRRLDFEITETAACGDIKQIYLAATALRTFGCGISLDDFGTGHANLSQLQDIPITQLKIDRRFVTDINRCSVSFNIVQSIYEYCRNMKIDCIVEGVETKEQLNALRSIGDMIIQGYFYSAPLDAAAIPAYLDRHQGIGNPQESSQFWRADRLGGEGA